MRTKEYSGIWWTTTNPENKICGNLTYVSGEYPILTLNGSFVLEEDLINKREEGEFYELILGLADNIKISLVNCVRRDLCFTRSGSGDYSRSKFSASMLCINNHFDGKDNLQFSRIVAQFSHLKEWLGSGIFSIPKTKQDKNELIVSLIKPLEKEIILNDFTLTIKGIWHSEVGIHQASLETDAVIIINTFQKKSLQQFFKIIYAIRNFLRLATGENITVVDIVTDENNVKTEIFVPNLVEEKRIKDQFSFCPTPIGFHQISKKLDIYLQNWFLFVEKFEPAYHLFFGIKDNRFYGMTEFLNLSQAIEAYHSRKYNNRLFPDDFIIATDNSTQFSTKITEILPDNQIKNSFRDKMKYINRKSLRMRIRELFKENSEVFDILINDKEKFISAFVDARNYYTHYDPEMEEPIEQSEILFLNDALRLIIISLFLRELEFDIKEIKRIIIMYRQNRIKRVYSLFS